MELSITSIRLKVKNLMATFLKRCSCKINLEKDFTIQGITKDNFKDFIKTVQSSFPKLTDQILKQECKNGAQLANHIFEIYK